MVTYGNNNINIKPTHGFPVAKAGLSENNGHDHFPQPDGAVSQWLCVLCVVGVSHLLPVWSQSFKLAPDLKLWGRRETADKHRHVSLCGEFAGMKNVQVVQTFIYRDLTV